MLDGKKDAAILDPKVVSRLAHVLWRIENEAEIKASTKQQNVEAWQRQKAPHLEKARQIVRMSKDLEFVARPD